MTEILTREQALEIYYYLRLNRRFEEALARSADLYEDLVGTFPVQAPYAVSLAYRIRYSMQMNAREAMHMLELRSSPQGHPAYRRIAQEMHRLIAEQAGHRAIATAMPAPLRGRCRGWSIRGPLSRMTMPLRARETRSSSWCAL